MRFEINAPLIAAAYCHCTRCQHRTGDAAQASARLAPGSLRVLSGEQHLHGWAPSGGLEKVFCGACGSALFARNPDTGEIGIVRLGGDRRRSAFVPAPRSWACCWTSAPTGRRWARSTGGRATPSRCPGRPSCSPAPLGVPRYPLRILRALPRAVPNLQDTPFGTLPGAGLAGAVTTRLHALVGGPKRRLDTQRFVAPHTSFNGRISSHRRFAFGCLSLVEVKAIKKHRGCTVNDAIVSICAGAVRRWLIEHDELPDEPLVAQVPVSVRNEAQVGTFGNRILLMSAPLFTNIADPIERLQATHEFLADMKQRHKALPATLLQDANHFIPPAVFARAAQLTFRLSSSRLAHPTWNLVISNVPGAQIPLYCAGARLVANYPVSVITDE